MSDKLINPIHFKPTWFFVRMPDEADHMLEAFGEGCLALRDADMIAIKVALGTFVMRARRTKDTGMNNMADQMELISKKLSAVLDAELGESEVEE